MLKIYTIGSSSHGIDEFINLLKEHKIKILADVRRFPTSKYEHFKKGNLSKLLTESGIEYVYLGKELGGFRAGGYEAYMKTADYKEGLDKLEAAARNKTVCFMCAEKQPKACHRRFIARSMSLRGWEVFDII